jgi:uncharacterized protein (TIGR02217 family)
LVANTRAEYDVSHGIKTQAQMDELTNFFYARRGRAYGFRFKDWNDYLLSQQVIALGDGATTSFQIIKTYVSTQAESGASVSFTRKLTKPKWDSVAGVTVGGVLKTAPGDYTVDYATGIITFAAPPANAAEVKIGAAEFHVPVRFDTDHLDAKHEFWMTQSWDSIPLIEVRDWSDLFQ